MNTYARTTILIRPDLLEQVRMFSKDQGTSIAQVIEKSLQKLLDEWESVHLQNMYQTLNKMDASGDPSITDASTTINEVLYGENGAWKGKQENEPRFHNES